ncbi:peroxidase-related enzyme [Sinorhizobium sp. BG8]|uniref:peroxidase-related enzyme n=1 Tax=Sinorhizobium sp. BG8 TaxID=2613773 RepID=UPI00193D6FCD|nr:peroxidase-related enzyme [Sinorhizobium sp. BG8]QRM57797.1 peroxidase-related enzyme [Sinorhizobium sp. BG8]
MLEKVATSSQSPARFRLPPPSPTELPEDVRTLVEANHEENWIRSLSVNGPTAKRFVSYFASLFDPGNGLLPIAERELIAVVVSSTNGCGLCEIHHTNALGDALGDAEKARRIALDVHLAPLTPRERALAEFAAKVTQEPKSVTPHDFEDLRAAGLNDAEIVEALETSAWFNHTNRIFISLGVWPDESYFGR